jgi:hypothetical protein
MFKLFDPYKRALKKMGFPAEQQGLINRYLKEKENWKTHLENTRNFIIQSIQDVEGEKIAILGSGWLMDLPVDFLFSKFKKILLYDVLHPAQVFHKYANDPKVEFHFTDITGNAILATWEMCKKKSHNLEKIPSEQFELPEDISFIVSLNILSQLDAFPVDFIQQRLDLDENEILDFRRKIQLNHFNLIKNRNSCLITDTDEIYHCPGDQISSKKTVLIDLFAEKFSVEWDWVFDTSGDYHENCETVMKVKALCFRLT